MNLKSKKALAIILTCAFVITVFSAFNLNITVFAKTINMEEGYNNSSWATNTFLFSKSDNLMQGALDPSNTQYQVISPSDGNEAYLIYKFNATSGKVFSAINFAFKGRAYTNTSIYFYGSTDNINYKYITKLQR